MSDIVVHVQDIAKKFVISHKTPRPYATLRGRVGYEAKVWRHKLFGGRPVPVAKREEFWALRGVSFAVRQGERVGIIGPNAAGKSTLLKIMSRITEPTSGRVRIRERVASLLEVGTGFHPELTGRENIFLNGAILGMSNAEVKAKFDAIVGFSEVEQFLDTPVKRYSSGMYVRLAFAVAAHLEPEILIVDEVLAVGDAAFQRKCLGRMDDMAQEGRTVLFVSHNMGLVQTLCNRGILLQRGAVTIDDTAENTVRHYLSMLEQAATESVATRKLRSGAGQVRLTGIEITGIGNHGTSHLAMGLPARFIFHVSTVQAGLSCCFTIYDQLGQPVTFFDTALHGRDDATQLDNGSKFVCEIDELPLMPGRYRINAAIMRKGELQDHLEAAAFFHVQPGHLAGRPPPTQAGYCNVLIKHRWV